MLEKIEHWISSGRWEGKNIQWRVLQNLVIILLKLWCLKIMKKNGWVAIHGETLQCCAIVGWLIWLLYLRHCVYVCKWLQNNDTRAPCCPIIPHSPCFSINAFKIVGVLHLFTITRVCVGACVCVCFLGNDHRQKLRVMWAPRMSSCVFLCLWNFVCVGVCVFIFLSLYVRLVQHK